MTAKTQRGILTEDGYFLIETSPGVFEDGDLTIHIEPALVAAQGYVLWSDLDVAYTLIEDADHMGERTAEIRRTLARQALERTHDVIPDLGICVDCLMYIANGDLPEDADRVRAIEAGCEQEGYTWVIEDGDTYDFSWSSCDCCGSRLGGARQGATLIRPKVQNKE